MISLLAKARFFASNNKTKEVSKLAKSVKPGAVTVTKQKETKNLQPKHKSTADLWPQGSNSFSQKVISVAGWNVNGIRAAIEKKQLQKFIDYHRPDFMCINETKIDFQTWQKDFKGKPIYPKYNQYWNFCKARPGYSGVLILTKHVPIKVYEDFVGIKVDASLKQEGRMLVLEYPKFYLVNVYMPFNQPERKSFVHDFRTQFIRQMQKICKQKPVIISGDMNITPQQLDRHQDKNKLEGTQASLQQKNKFKKQLVQLGFTDTFRAKHPLRKQHSWITRLWLYLFGKVKPKYRIDYIFSSKQWIVHQADFHKYREGSDHHPISAKLELKK